MHPTVGRLTVNHLHQAYANVQAYVWPDMGNPRGSAGRNRLHKAATTLEP